MTSFPITHRGSDNDPVTPAAYMHLLGESLSLIGHCLQETDVGAKTNILTFKMKTKYDFPLLIQFSLCLETGVRV